MEYMYARLTGSYYWRREVDTTVQGKAFARISLNSPHQPLPHGCLALPIPSSAQVVLSAQRRARKRMKRTLRTNTVMIEAITMATT